MTRVALVQVKIDAGFDAEHRRDILTKFVLPVVSALPGFRSGMWLNDGQGTGTCVVQFDTEAQAERALDVLASENGPEVIQRSICEVELED